MQLSKFTDYSFRALIYLALNKDERCTVQVLAQRLDTSIHHMKKVIHNLSKYEYVTSQKGRNGGLCLGLEPKDINLGEILKITEENMNLFDCFSNKDSCPLAKGCKLKAISNKALSKFIDEFEKYTLEDLL